MIENKPTLAKLVMLIRRLMAETISLDAPQTCLEQASDDLEKVLLKLSEYKNPSIPKFDPSGLQDNLNMCMPYSPISGLYNPLSPQINFIREGTILKAEVCCDKTYEGPPASIHGGVISGIYDQLLAMAALIQGAGGPTAYLKIDYKLPHPLQKTLCFSARLERTEGKKLYVTGDCYYGDQLLSQANALFITMDFSKDDRYSINPKIS